MNGLNVMGARHTRAPHDNPSRHVVNIWPTHEAENISHDIRPKFGVHTLILKSKERKMPQIDKLGGGTSRLDAARDWSFKTGYLVSSSKAMS